MEITNSFKIHSLQFTCISLNGKEIIGDSTQGFQSGVGYIICRQDDISGIHRATPGDDRYRTRCIISFPMLNWPVSNIEIKLHVRKANLNVYTRNDNNTEKLFVTLTYIPQLSHVMQAQCTYWRVHRFSCA